MKNPEWIDTKAACSLLGVKPQTLYAYVSRKTVRVTSDPTDARRSLYAHRDVAALAKRTRRPRARKDIAAQAIRWGDPVMETRISEIRDGRLWVRGRSIEDCARILSLEEMAGHLLDSTPLDSFAIKLPSANGPPLGRALAFLAHAAADAHPLSRSDGAAVSRSAAYLLSGMTEALLSDGQDGPTHVRLGKHWALDAPGTDAVRRALVLLSDHELNPSTFAVRVCASTGASLPATLLAGMATYSGPRHGGVDALSRQAIGAAMAGNAETFLTEVSTLSPYQFGFGHPLYPDGDPRAVQLFARLPENAPPVRAVFTLADKLGHPPNVDAGLAAMSLHLSLPVSGAWTIFALGRLTGWMAHAVEQANSGAVIRPRAQYRSS